MMASRSSENLAFFILAFLLCIGSPSALAVSEPRTTGYQTEVAPEQSELNYGEDFSRPLARFDVRFRYRSKADGSDDLRNTYRLDYPMTLRNGWQVATRTDLPVVANDTAGPDNSEGHWAMGLGDFLTQAALVSPANKPFRYGTGLRVLWPTASEQQMGSGKYQLVPLAGFSFSLRSLSDGSFFQFAWREPFSVGGDEGRKDIHNSVFNPAMTVSLPRQFYVTSSPDITVHWAQGGKWFVPFNLSAGKKFGKRMIFSLEWDQAVVKEYREYDWQIEARIGYFF